MEPVKNIRAILGLSESEAKMSSSDLDAQEVM